MIIQLVSHPTLSGVDIRRIRPAKTFKCLKVNSKSIADYCTMETLARLTRSWKLKARAPSLLSLLSKLEPVQSRCCYTNPLLLVHALGVFSVQTRLNG